MLSIFLIAASISISAHSAPISTDASKNMAAVIDSLPAVLKGNFTDDYGIHYSINDSLWTQHPNTRYQIIKWNKEEQFFIAVNHVENKSAPGKFTRIDYLLLPNMRPYEWGFCLSVYDASSAQSAENGYKPDRENPRKGCNGFPFSRMKRTE